MNNFKYKLDNIAKQCQQNYLSIETVEHGDFEAEYKDLRIKALELYPQAQQELTTDDLTTFKKQLLEFLCQNSGCTWDIDILENAVPHILSDQDMRYIQTNSSLGRWY